MITIRVVFIKESLDRREESEEGRREKAYQTGERREKTAESRLPNFVLRDSVERIRPVTRIVFIDKS
jgi:hypothetical protein